MKCFCVRKDTEICLLRPATITEVNAEVVDIILLRSATLPIVITEDMLVEADLGHKRPSTLHLEIREHEFMLKGEVDIGLRPSTINPATKLTVVASLIH